MVRNMVTSLLEHGRVETTDAKAKEVRRVAERMITLGKRGTLHARRRALRVIRDREVAARVFGDLADRFRAIPGVAVVNVNGSLRRELSVLLRAEKLREYNVSVTEVVNAVRVQNATAPVGKVRGSMEDQSIRLVGRRSNRDGVGAVVRVTADGITQRRFASGSRGYLSASDPRLHFGLGPATRADVVQVAWPSGARSVLRNVGADRVVTVEEGERGP